MKAEICPECGADSFKTHDYDRLQRENNSLSRQHTTQAALFGVKKAEAWLREIRLEDSMKYLQRKTKKQAEVIKRLEDRLKRLGQQPYKEEE